MKYNKLIEKYILQIPTNPTNTRNRNLSTRHQDLTIGNRKYEYVAYDYYNKLSNELKNWRLTIKTLKKKLKKSNQCFQCEKKKRRKMIKEREITLPG